MRSLRMEFFKCRRRRLWLPLLIMMAAQLAWGLYSMRDLSAKELQQGWAIILYNFPMLNAMMTPVIAAVVASRMADIEHKGQTLKLLETVQRTGALFDSKFICGAVYMTLFVLVQIAVILCFGMISGFHGAPPLDKIGEYFAATLLTTLTVSAAAAGAVASDPKPDDRHDYRIDRLIYRPVLAVFPAFVPESLCLGVLCRAVQHRHGLGCSDPHQ